jgi:hypothetical protein
VPEPARTLWKLSCGRRYSFNCSVLATHFQEALAFFKVIAKNKYLADGKRNDSYFSKNHLYMVPASGENNYAAAVSFVPLDHSTYTQHKYTNWITHRSDKEAKDGFTLPAGGVYRFYRYWKKYFPDG